MLKWEKRALQIAAVLGLGSYPSAMVAYHNRMLDFGRKVIDFKVPDDIVELVEDELDHFKDLLMKVNADVAVTSSLNPESRGGFYFRNGFELLLPVRAVAKDVAELRKMGSIISVETKSGFSRKINSVDITTEAGKTIFDGYLLSDKARRFLIRRELHRANMRRFVFGPVFLWILLVGIVALTFLASMRFGRLLSYGSLVLLVPLAAVTFRDGLKRLHSYGEMTLDHDTCADSPDYVEGARQYLKSSIATNLRIRKILGDTKSEFIAANGDRVGDLWPYSKRLKAIELFAAEEFKKQK